MIGSAKKYLRLVTKDMQLSPAAVSALIIDLLSYKVFYSEASQITIPTRFATVQSFQRVATNEDSSMLNSRVPQAYVAIGRASKDHDLNPLGLKQAIELIDRVLMGDSFAGLGHFARSGVLGFYCVEGRVFTEPGTLDYGRLFVGTPHETLVRRTAAGFEALNNLGVWSEVPLHDVVQEELHHCWLIGRQDTESLFANHQVLVRVSGDNHHWLQLLFESDHGKVSAIGFRGLHSGPGIYLGPRGHDADLPSLIVVDRLPTMTLTKVETWISGL